MCESYNYALPFSLYHIVLCDGEAILLVVLFRCLR